MKFLKNIKIVQHDKMKICLVAVYYIFNYHMLINSISVTDCVYGHQTNLRFITLHNFNVF